MGIYLSQPETNKNISEGINQKKGISFISAQMQGWRKNMQDTAIHQISLSDGNAVFGVFDGHGGPQVSEYVKQKFLSILTSQPTYKRGDYEAALVEAFRNMDETINSSEGAAALKALRNKAGNGGSDYSSNEDQVGNGTGCTANVVLITYNDIYVANAGVSRSVLCRGGKAIVLSQDHRPQLPQQQKRILKAGGKIYMGRVNGNLNMSRSLGDFDYKRKKQLKYNQQMITCYPEVCKLQRQKKNNNYGNIDQFIIMGCDGIWQRYVDSSQGLIDIMKADLKKSTNQKKMMEDLLNILLAKDTNAGIGCDNMTVILIKFL